MEAIIGNTIHPADLAFFSTLASSGSMSAAARELGITKAGVSKRLIQIEERLGSELLTRTTRHMSLTSEGEIFLEGARRIVGAIDDLEELLTANKVAPRGVLRINSTLGFGRSHIAPIVSRFARKHGQVEMQLQLSVTPPPLADDLYDVCIRFGPPADGRVISRLIAPNRRLLCASPGYLAKHGVPKEPRDLTRHSCIGIRQGEEAYGVWRLTSGHGNGAATESIKVRGTLATNDGGIAVSWALEGHGILMRAEWDIEHYLKNGRLVQVLPLYRTPDADIYAIYPERHRHTARVKAFVDFVSLAIGRQAPPAAT